MELRAALQPPTARSAPSAPAPAPARDKDATTEAAETPDPRTVSLRHRPRLFALLAADKVAFAPADMSATTATASTPFVNRMTGLFWLTGAPSGGPGGNALKASGDGPRIWQGTS